MVNYLVWSIGCTKPTTSSIDFRPAFIDFRFLCCLIFLQSGSHKQKFDFNWPWFHLILILKQISQISSSIHTDRPWSRIDCRRHDHPEWRFSKCSNLNYPWWRFLAQDLINNLDLIVWVSMISSITKGLFMFTIVY